MQLTYLAGLIPVLQLLQAVSAYPSLHDSYDLYTRDLETLLYPESQRLYARAAAALFPRTGGSGSRPPTPEVPLTTAKHGGGTIQNKEKGGLPTHTHLLPAGEQQDRSDMGNKHGSKVKGTAVDHAIPAGSVEGKKASKEGKNRLAEVPAKEQNSEGGLERAAARKAEKQGSDKVKHTIDGKPAGEVTGAGSRRGSAASIGSPALAAKSRHSGNARRSLLAETGRHLFARNAAADAYAEALAAFDDALELQQRDAYAFAEPEAFIWEDEFGYDF